MNNENKNYLSLNTIIDDVNFSFILKQIKNIFSMPLFFKENKEIIKTYLNENKLVHVKYLHQMIKHYDCEKSININWFK